MLAITTYCTKSYTYALSAQIPRTVAALRYAGVREGVFVMAGDDSAEVQEAFHRYEEALGKVGFTCHLVVLPVKCNENAEHRLASNVVIARLQDAAWHRARLEGAETLWSLESDILPPANALQVMRDALAFDRGWYDVAFCTYPNSAYLGGHGSPRHWIAPNIYPDERVVPEELREREKRWQEKERVAVAERRSVTDEEVLERRELREALEACEAKGNVFALNAAQWRRRGWLESAYPGIGLGAMVPTDWVGLGCTLMSARAFDLASFIGYGGHGTQDLWLCWKVWHPAALKLCVLPHAVCSHVKQRRRPDGVVESLEIMHAQHVLGGECHGHLRTDVRTWDGL